MPFTNAGATAAPPSQVSKQQEQQEKAKQEQQQQAQQQLLQQATQLQQRMDWAQDVTRSMPALSGQRPWRPDPPVLPAHTHSATRQVVQSSANPTQAWALWLCSPDFMFV